MRRAMSQQDGNRQPRDTHHLLILLLFMLFSASATAGEINACKYLIVGDFTSDPYGIAKELRAQATARGFIVVSAVSEVPQADLLKACVMSGSWARELRGGELSVRVVDVPSRVPRVPRIWGPGRPPTPSRTPSMYDADYFPARRTINLE